jgi:hypothetical protein
MKADASIVKTVKTVAELKMTLRFRAHGETKNGSDLKHERKNEMLWVLREKKIGIVRTSFGESKFGRERPAASCESESRHAFE